jgi:hypothetical protein
VVVTVCAVSWVQSYDGGRRCGDEAIVEASLSVGVCGSVMSACVLVLRWSSLLKLTNAPCSHCSTSLTAQSSVRRTHCRDCGEFTIQSSLPLSPPLPFPLPLPPVRPPSSLPSRLVSSRLVSLFPLSHWYMVYRHLHRFHKGKGAVHTATAPALPPGGQPCCAVMDGDSGWTEQSDSDGLLHATPSSTLPLPSPHSVGGRGHFCLVALLVLLLLGSARISRPSTRHPVGRAEFRGM